MSNSCCVNFDITIEQGATFRWPIEYQEEDGSVIDITDYDVLFQVRATPTDEDVVLEASVDDGRVVVTGDEGLIVITVPKEVTAALEAGFRGSYNVLITSPSGVADRILQGGAYVSPSTARVEEEEA